ncbi:MAG: zf-TFIIB domain-containing protein [Fimbriimonadaceae bacterium]
MKCPKCEVIELTMSDRAGVEIDYCAACRGVWLDRGELDKIIERSSISNPIDSRVSDPDPMRGRDRYRDWDDDDDDDDRRSTSGRRKKGFLSDLFDF